MESLADNTYPIVELKEVFFGYSYSHPILEGMNLKFAKGSFTGVLGTSGSGKTTLLKLIAGIYRPWRGQIYLNNKESGNSPGKLIIGYVPQVESIDWTFPITVREVVAMGAWNRSGKFPWISHSTDKAVKKLLDSLGLDASKYTSRQISELSGGEQQRVFLARALISRPEIIILDEPTSGVDHNTREIIIDMLFKLSEDGKTIIISTHDISGIARRLPWVICINKHVISEGIPNEILTPENIMKTYGIKDIPSEV